MPLEQLTPSHAQTFRHSVPIRLAAYWALLLCTAISTWLGLHVLPVYAIFLVTLFETVVLLACHRLAVASPSVAAVYLGLEATCQTAVFFLCGDIRVGIAPIVYTFELINPGLRLSRVGHFVAANGFCFLFVTLVVAEHSGIVSPEWAHAPSIAPGLDAVSVLIVVASLNLAAVFVSEAARLLESRTLELALAKETLQTYSAELEGRVRQRTDDLERSYRTLQEKAEELRAFVYTVTHDLKNPLSNIVLRADMVLEREGQGLSPAAAADLKRIMRSAEHTENMIRDLLELFRITSSPEEPSWVSLQTLVQQAVAVLAERITAKATDVQISPLPTVWGKEHKLGHVVTNLLDNATKYVGSAGGRVAVEAVVENGWLTLAVRDNGIGIPEPYQQRIFETFVRVPRDEQLVDGNTVSGSGVGLAAVKEIVDEHGGEVWVESEVGVGSTFYARIPRGPHE